MSSEIMKISVQYGIFCVLFCALLKYVLDNNKIRENKLQETIFSNQNIIEKLTEKFNILEDVKKDIEEVKNVIKK